MEDLHLLFEIAKILAREKTTGLNEKEALILKNWLEGSNQNKILYDELNNTDILIDELSRPEKYHSVKALKKISSQLTKAQKTSILNHIPAFYKYAAAIILLIACTGIICFFSISKHSYMSADIEPGTQKAILITSNNRHIELGKTQKKSVYRDKYSILIDSNSTLSCQSGYSVHDPESKENDREYYQLITPRGGEYTLFLPDSTKVKLNSQSRLKFPIMFDKGSRVVELEGEAYFEVARSEKDLFIVKANEIKTVVYGTSFNLSAYSDDMYIHTTLVSGSIGIEWRHEQTTGKIELEPGQLASYNKESDNMTTREVNTSVYTAWTTGMFVFENEPLEQILRKLSRWYDFEVEFKDESLKKEPFTGDVKRYDDISEILDMISLASGIGFKISDETITVYPEKRKKGNAATFPNNQ